MGKPMSVSMWCC